MQKCRMRQSREASEKARGGGNTAVRYLWEGEGEIPKRRACDSTTIDDEGVKGTAQVLDGYGTLLYLGDAGPGNAPFTPVARVNWVPSRER